MLKSVFLTTERPMSAMHNGEGASDLVPVPALSPAPTTWPSEGSAEPTRMFSVSPWVKRAALSTAKMVATAAVTVVVNVVALAIAIPLGIAADNLFWSIAFTEGGLLAVCVVAAIALATRARRGQSAGLLVGWVTAYLGLIGVVLIVIVGLTVVIFGAMAVFWALAIIFS
jgi:hypothetical protein